MLRKWIAGLTLLVVVISGAVVTLVPSVRARAESIPMRLETWWREQQPHDLYVPPADLASETLTPTGTPSTVSGAKTPQAQANERPTAATQPTRAPAVAVANAPAEFRLNNFRHEYQRWNNCGPVTVGMLLSHFGFNDTQTEIAPILKPNTNDKNVSPSELAAYVETKPGFHTLVRVNGTLDLLKGLLANGFPIVVETWFTPKPNDGMGHYRLLIGYNDAQQKFLALDSYNGPNVTLPYAEFDADWKAFNRLYLVAYMAEKAALLAAIVGEAMADSFMWSQARDRAESEIAANQGDAFAWHNLGSALAGLGQHQEAAKAFDRARKIGLPWRMLWYQFAMFDAYLAVGRNADVLALTAANLKQAGDLEESYFYRGRALQALGKTDEAIKAYREALRLNKNYQAAVSALKALGAI